MPLPKFITNLVSGGATKLIESVSGVVDEFTLSKEEKENFKIKVTEIANAHEATMLQEATKQFESENNAVTERWKADMGSDSWLSKNTRPLVMLSLLAVLFLMITFDSLEIKFNVKESYIQLMETLLITVVVAYFGSRGVEKFKSIHEAKKKV